MRRQLKGFTLPELVIVLAIIALLMRLVMQSFSNDATEVRQFNEQMSAEAMVDDEMAIDLPPPADRTEAGPAPFDDAGPRLPGAQSPSSANLGLHPAAIGDESADALHNRVPAPAGAVKVENKYEM